MKAWQAPILSELPGKAPLPRIFDTAAAEKVQLEAEDTASMYVCGITPYDATHMGHASTYVAFDLLYRAWGDSGVAVTYAQNVTDVDDPLLERARRDGRDWRQLAEEQTELFRTDMEALQVIPPDHYVGAVESIPWVVEAVEDLLERDLAYPVAAGDSTGPHSDIYFYFDVQKAAVIAPQDPAHWFLGQISHLNREQMLPLFAERGGDPQRSGKRHVLDPLLWRGAREGEPSWTGGKLGDGRPGWHIECATISQKLLPSPFSVQGGGADLQFPHHEMGAGHSYALTGKPMARHYMHTGMVGLDGKKMSKSLGNLVLVSRLRSEGVDPAAIRLAIMDNHYREDWFWTSQLLTRAQQRQQNYTRAVEKATADADSATYAVLDRVRQQLADDLNAPSALETLDRWADSTLTQIEAGQKPGGGQLMRDILSTRLGVKL